MPTAVSYPGVYIEELPSGVHTIIGVPTSIAAFVGPTLAGPPDIPQVVNSFSEFERVYGGLWDSSALPGAVQQFYLNGGQQAVILRLLHMYGPDGKPVKSPPVQASIPMDAGPALTVKYAGTWGNNVRALVDYDTKDPTNAKLYNLTVRDTGSTGIEETYYNVEADPASTNSLDRMLLNSVLVTVDPAKQDLSKRPNANDPPPFGGSPWVDPPPAPPAAAAPGGGGGAGGPGGAAPAAQPKYSYKSDGKGSDGDPATASQLSVNDYTGGPTGPVDKTGIYSLLDDSNFFNMLCLPSFASVDPSVLTGAAQLCAMKRAMLLIDPPDSSTWNSEPAAEAAFRKGPYDSLGDNKQNAAIYFPRVLAPNSNGVPTEYPPCGVVAGIYARIDGTRGVWKAPAGIEASLTGVTSLPVSLNNLENGLLNVLGVNCFRTFQVIGNVVWGARTLVGADVLANQWKYVPVRRLALFLEESLYRGSQWIVFEPNDEPLWAQIRLNFGAFMHSMFVQGAFEGTTPQDAYFVKCDKDTTTQNDIDQGIVNIIVGFAPLKPAEFVIIKIQQLAGQLAV